MKCPTRRAEVKVKLKVSKAGFSDGWVFSVETVLANSVLTKTESKMTADRISMKPAFYKPGFQICVAAASQGGGIYGVVLSTLALAIGVQLVERLNGIAA